MILETAAGALGEAVFSKLADAACAAVKTKQDRVAFHRALNAALQTTDADYRRIFADFDVNTGFLDHEAAQEIARIFLSGRGPSARRLAIACSLSLGGTQRPHSADALVPPFEAFLQTLTEELARHPAFREVIHQVGTTRCAVDAPMAAREYLQWVVDRFSFLQTAGIGTMKHVQLQLDSVFVQPRGNIEEHGGIRWSTKAEEEIALLRERLKSGEISHEEYEAYLDRLGLEQAKRAEARPAPLDVLEMVRATQRLLVLGDPGSGKTTLLLYLATRHARALLDGIDYTGELGEARLPLYVRAGDFARAHDRQAGLRAFIVPYITGKLECNVSPAELEAVIGGHLRSGSCVVLIDGLDEVSTADQRIAIVETITNLVVAEAPRGNHFICTSRISGYAAAPLPPDFPAVRLAEMAEPAIETFLRLYVPAIERAEAPSKSAAVIAADADHTVTNMLQAFRSSPGVRRLLTNPLLLTAVVLVHRTQGALPERRIDAYKAVTDALGHTWRAKQGIPEAELPDERRLTRWLTRLAAWMHAARPEGSATLRDLLEQWGPLWAELQRTTWNDEVLDEADVGSTPPGRAITVFVEEVERHSGLLVERAPRRWGFPHLTFEEFYAGRALAFEGRTSTRARRIREHLHDPRYDEPILLALGLVGREQPEEAEALFESTFLARGDDAERLQLTASTFEDILGRDFRFALQALADDISATPRIVDELVAQAIREVVELAGRGQFQTYRSAVLDLLADLKAARAGNRVVALAADLPSTLVIDRASGFVDLASRLPADERLVDHLMEVAVRANRQVAFRATDCVKADQRTAVRGIARLVDRVATASDNDAIRVAEILLLLGKAAAPAPDPVEPAARTDAATRCSGDDTDPLSQIATRLDHICCHAGDDLALSAAELLFRADRLTPGAVERLVMIATGLPTYGTSSEQSGVVADKHYRIGSVLTELDPVQAKGVSPDAVSRAVAATRSDPHSYRWALGLVATQERLTVDVTDSLVDLARVPTSTLWQTMLDAMVSATNLPERFYTAIGEVALSNDSSSGAAAEFLGKADALPDSVASLLCEIAAGPDPRQGDVAATVLQRRRSLPPAVVKALANYAEAGDDTVLLRLAPPLREHHALNARVIRRTVSVTASASESLRRPMKTAIDRGGLPEEAVAVLDEIATHGEADDAVWAASILCKRGLSHVEQERLGAIALEEPVQAALTAVQALIENGHREREAWVSESGTGLGMSAGLGPRDAPARSATTAPSPTVLPDAVSRRLAQIVVSSEVTVALDAAEMLRLSALRGLLGILQRSLRAGELSRAMTDALLFEGELSFHDSPAADEFATSYPDVIARLVGIARSEAPSDALRAARLVPSRSLPPDVSQRVATLREEARGFEIAGGLVGGFHAAPPAVRAVEAVSKALDWPIDVTAAERSLQTIAGTESLPATSTRMLLKHLLKPNAPVAAELAARAIGSLKALDEETIEELTQAAVGSESQVVAVLACDVLDQHGAMRPVVVDRLRQIAARGVEDSNATRACEILARHERLPAAAAARCLAIATFASDAFDCIAAARLCATLEPVPEPAFLRLCIFVAGEDELAASRAFRVLRRARTVPDAAVPALMRFARSSASVELRLEASDGVFAARDRIDGTLQFFIDGLTDSVPTIRADATSRLVSLAREDQSTRDEAVIAVLEALGANPPSDRWAEQASRDAAYQFLVAIVEREEEAASRHES